MASLASPDRRPDLSGLDMAETNGTDARAALLKANAEMFVAAPVRDREMIETFEMLALGFLPMVSHATLVEIARILAACEDTPASVLDHLARHSPQARDIVLKGAARLPSPQGDKRLATREGRMRLASRSDIEPALAERLLVLHEDDIDDRLAANAGFVPAEPAFDALVRRAQHRPALAALLLARSDLACAQEAALYLSASPERRAQIRNRIAASLAHRRAKLTFVLTQHDMGEFLDAAKEGDARRLECLMNAALGFPPATDWCCLQIGRHGLLALGLKALGFAHKDAARVFIALHPALSHPLSALKALARIVRDVPSPVALALVESILDVQALSWSEATQRALADAQVDRRAFAALAQRGQTNADP
ncbi:hypothetical protein [Microvirga lenta]|uniref:hypothetical protein n=1 Tax=Microvirga lenta TaxID=2881337 RepID=UPI001CFF7A2F|nr:hypothetical protein [Microvirga lenta]MCB5176317.1 hypothetical protein [Microvirga lenta]